MPRQPTLRQVAERSGVSISTVSRVLNGHREGFSVREETRQRVLGAAEELNYRPDPIVRTIRAKRTNLVAVLGLRDLGTTIRGPTEEAVNSLMNRLYEAGLELCTNLLSPRMPRFSLPGWRVDGAVVLDCADVTKLGDVDAAGIPYVTVNCSAGPRGSSVRMDDEDGARRAVRHLLELGHQRIAYVVHDDPDSPVGGMEQNRHESITARHRGYMEELESNGIAPLTPMLPPHVPAQEAVHQCVAEQGATGLLVYHHIMAVRVLSAIHHMGLHVPEDVSIMCFNDLFPCADVIPALTAMSLPAKEMGRAAAEILTEHLENGSREPRHLVWTESLVARDSTGPAPRR